MDVQVYNLSYRITTMIELETSYPKGKITRMTNINNDIGVDGDDAEELLYKYSEKFDIDMSSFEFCRSFNSEAVDSISILKSIFGLGNKRALEAITVDMLEKSALLYKCNY